MEHFFTSDLWEALAPALFTLLSGLAAWLLGVVAMYLPKPLRAFYEKKLKQDLQDAADNAARAALEGDFKHFDFDKDDQRELVNYIVGMMREGAGEAIQVFGPSGQKLEQLALAGVSRVLDGRFGTVGETISNALDPEPTPATRPAKRRG